MNNRLVIYRTSHSGEYSWDGAVEFTLGRGFFKKTEHAPITHAKTAAEVFTWLHERYPDREIAFDPAISQRYSK